MAGQIIARGGGGFSMEPETTLDDYVLDLVDAELPRVCFLPTASGDSAEYTERFYQAFQGRAEPTHLGLFARSVEDPTAFLLEQDVVYVGGGNTANMLAVWRTHGVDLALRRAWQEGVSLCGVSAGCLCGFEGGVTDSFGPALGPLRDGLGFLPGSNSPHYDHEGRRPLYHQLIREGLPAGIAADDGAALHFVGTELVRVVTSREGARAYRVERTPDGEVRETVVTAARR